AAQNRAPIVAWILSPMLLAGTVVILYATFVRGRLSIWVHARGVAVRRGSKTIAALWSEIEKVHYEEAVGPAFYLVLHVGALERIARFEVRLGRIAIEEKGPDARKFCEIRVAEVANFSALEALLEWAIARDTPAKRGISARPRTAME